MDNLIKYCGTCGSLMLQIPSNTSALNYICPICNKDRGQFLDKKPEPIIEENVIPSGRILLEG